MANFDFEPLAADAGLFTGTQFHRRGASVKFRVSGHAGSPDFFAISGLTTDNYPNGERLMGSSTDPNADLMFKTFVARPVFADDFESSNTNAWSTTQP